MKKFLFLGLVFFAFFNNYAQTPITFNNVKYYFGDSLNSSGLIKSMAKIDSNYYLGVDAFSDSLLFTSYFVKIDKYGNKISQSPRFGSDSVAYFVATGNGMIIDNDSNVIVVGDYIKGQWGGFAIKLDRNMDTIWAKQYRFPDSLINFGYSNPRHLFKAISQTLDGNYIVMGSYFLDSNYYYNDIRPYLIKLDKNGNILWRKLYPNLGSCFDIAVTSDSGFVFTPHNYNQDEVCKTDSLGNIEWFVNANSLLHFVSFDITVSGNDIISVAPYVYYNDGNISNYRYGLDVIKTNSTTGQIVWNKQFIPMNSVKCPTLHNHLEVVVDANDNIIIAATGEAYNYDSTAKASKGFLMKLNSNGDSLWTHFYDWGSFFQRDAQFNDFVITDDGGILAGGFWNPPYLNYKQGAWLVKTDSMGNAPDMFTVGIEENELVLTKNRINIYPNPATENINLGFEKSTKEVMELLIYNSSGALVKQQKLQAYAQEYRIDIQNLSVGVYIVHLQSKGNIMFSSKFVKQ